MPRCGFSIAALAVLLVVTPSKTTSFVPLRPSWVSPSRRYVSELQKTSVEEDDSLAGDVLALGKHKKIPNTLRTEGSGIPARNSAVQILDPAMYETELIKSWEDDPERQSGFDWEIEKLRRYFAGLRMRQDGTWVRKPSFFDFLVSKTRVSTEASNNRLSPRPVNIMDVGILVASNLLNGLGFGPALGMAAVPDAVIQKYEGSFYSFIKGALGGDLQTLAGGPLFLLLAKYFQDYGPIFNLSFGPKSFLVISDPVMARHILRDSPTDQYCKGMLAEILEPIMGKGLIPADPVTWKVRRRAIVPAFHKRWLNRMVTLFAERAEILVDDLETKADKAQVVDMEERFCSVTLDIIGKAVFNYDFGSVTKESPIVKAVYRVLREAEHRSSSFIPYWNLPYADKWMGGQVEFRKDMDMLDDILADLINRAVSTRQEATAEELEARDNEEDPSLLRFLVDMRGEDVSSMVLRDDLMTMLIAGHETTAAMLTWTLFELAKGDPGLLSEVQAEVRTVLKDKDRPDYDDLVAMKKLRFSLIEALRLYPEPPVLIRRARMTDNLPPGGSGLSGGVKLLRGTDMFISTWNLHRSPELWEDPEKFDPTRWDRRFRNPGVRGWEGYDPDKVKGLYPNEQAADFAFLPFGGGQRKCVGDQFAMMEATVSMVSKQTCEKAKQPWERMRSLWFSCFFSQSILLNNYDFTFATSADDVGMKTGATIHTMNGLNMYPRKISKDADPPKTDGWWENQHLKRGLSENGRPYPTEEDAVWQTTEKTAGRNHSPGDTGGCPVQH
jgi:cytochrome P450